MKSGYEMTEAEARSVVETMRHKREVAEYMGAVIVLLQNLALCHDDSKMEGEELKAFAIGTPKLRELTYGSDEYKETLKSLGPAIKSHQESNAHHPEHYGEDGISGMDLLDLIEMLADWKAATKRYSDGSIVKSLDINRERFKIDPQLFKILENTIGALGWDR